MLIKVNSLQSIFLSNETQPTLEQAIAEKAPIRKAVIDFARGLQFIDGAKDCLVARASILNHYKLLFWCTRYRQASLLFPVFGT